MRLLRQRRSALSERRPTKLVCSRGNQTGHGARQSRTRRQFSLGLSFPEAVRFHLVKLPCAVPGGGRKADRRHSSQATLTLECYGYRSEPCFGVGATAGSGFPAPRALLPALRLPRRASAVSASRRTSFVDSFVRARASRIAEWTARVIRIVISLRLSTYRACRSAPDSASDLRWRSIHHSARKGQRG